MRRKMMRPRLFNAILGLSLLFRFSFQTQNTQPDTLHELMRRIDIPNSKNSNK
jgi:hypothetical protein